MITKISASIMRNVFKKSTYRFDNEPKDQFSPNFGIYIHVPFCHSICKFCPFYKERFTENIKNQYVNALIQEIQMRNISGSVKWVYFGGGTPNVFTLEDFKRVINALQEKVKLSNLGIELLPSILTMPYLEGLKQLGFSKISLGIESLTKIVLQRAERANITPDNLQKILQKAKELGLRTNIDMMVGLTGQTDSDFLTDIDTISNMRPTQITIYPYMSIRGVPETKIPDSKQFKLIEQAGKKLIQLGYSRKGVWVYAFDDNLYDSSRDELVQDYAGFGAAAFSTFDKWKVVNPEVGPYMKMIQQKTRKGFVGIKTPDTDDWRKFARTLYDLRTDFPTDLPNYIKKYIGVLKHTGFIKKNQLLQKGILLGHALTKTVVESLPFPLQNPNVVENYSDYVAYKDNNTND
jgi:coproporphyrinogen III oxidase-like Fe-S oxidoreductase